MVWSRMSKCFSGLVVYDVPSFTFQCCVVLVSLAKSRQKSQNTAAEIFFHWWKWSSQTLKRGNWYLKPNKTEKALSQEEEEHTMKTDMNRWNNQHVVLWVWSVHTHTQKHTHSKVHIHFPHTHTATGLLYDKYTHTCPLLVYTCAHPNQEKITLDRKITPI